MTLIIQGVGKPLKVNLPVHYIHFNPVKHSHVNNVIDWPHSSFHRYVRNGLLAEDWGGQVPVEGDRYGE